MRVVQVDEGRGLWGRVRGRSGRKGVGVAHCMSRRLRSPACKLVCALPTVPQVWLKCVDAVRDAGREDVESCASVVGSSEVNKR